MNATTTVLAEIADLDEWAASNPPADEWGAIHADVWRAARSQARAEAFDAVLAFLDGKHTPDGLLERNVIRDKIADLRR